MTHESVKSIDSSKKRETPCQREDWLQRDLNNLPKVNPTDTLPDPIFPLTISPKLKTGTKKLTRP